MSNDNVYSNLIKNTMENLKDMIDVEKIVGNPICTSNNTTIIPLSKLTFGFISGGSEFPINNTHKTNDVFPFGGGSSSGVSIKPMALLIIKDDNIRLMPISQNNSTQITDIIPQILSTIEELCKNSSHKKEKTHTSYSSTKI